MLIDHILSYSIFVLVQKHGLLAFMSSLQSLEAWNRVKKQRHWNFLTLWPCAMSLSSRGAIRCFRFARWEQESEPPRSGTGRRHRRAVAIPRGPTAADLCGSCWLAGISHEVHETHMNRTVEETNSRKPARLICGKHCGFVAVHNPPRLQG